MIQIVVICMFRIQTTGSEVPVLCTVSVFASEAMALVALPLRHNVLQPLQQHIWAAAAALGTGPLTGGGGG